MNKTSEKSTGQLINEYEANGTLSAPDAQALRDAPMWVVPFTDIAAYLGGSVVFVGLVWIVIALLQDMSQATITGALLIVSGTTAALAVWLSRQGGKKQTLSEFITAVSTTSFAIGIGLVLDIANVQENLILIIAAATALAIGGLLITRTAFIGTVIVVAATQPFLAGVITKFLADTSVGPLLFVGSGTLLLWFAQHNIGLQFLARGSGAISVMFAAISYSAWNNNQWQPTIGLVITGLLFAYGARVYYLEVIAAGGLGVTIITGILAGILFDSAFLQGLAVIASGLAIVIASLAIAKKSKRIP